MEHVLYSEVHRQSMDLFVANSNKRPSAFFFYNHFVSVTEFTETVYRYISKRCLLLVN